MVLYIISMGIGTFMFNSNFRLIDKILFENKKKILANNQKLRDGEWIEEEIQLIKKHGHKIVYLGNKKTNFKGIECINDNKKKILALTKISELEKVYSRLREAGIIIAKEDIKNSIKQDTLLIQAINCINDLDRIANIMIKRVREFYKIYCPEFEHLIKDHIKFVNIILKKSRDEILRDINVSEEDSMGAKLSKHDIELIKAFGKEVKDIFELRNFISKYIEKIMKDNYPNLYALVGSQIGAKLIKLAGGFERLSRMPASTIQLLGAEEALFRHIRTGCKSPKYGIIHEHPLILNAKKNEQGKIARALADKIAIAVKVDYFKGKFIGDELLKNLEKRFNK